MAVALATKFHVYAYLCHQQHDGGELCSNKRGSSLIWKKWRNLMRN